MFRAMLLIPSDHSGTEAEAEQDMMAKQAVFLPATQHLRGISSFVCSPT